MVMVVVGSDCHVKNRVGGEKFAPSAAGDSTAPGVSSAESPRPRVRAAASPPREDARKARRPMVIMVEARNRGAITRCQDSSINPQKVKPAARHLPAASPARHPGQ